jgi:hypothetical protein
MNRVTNGYGAVDRGINRADAAASATCWLRVELV